MLLRILLIVAILAGVGVVAVTQFMVRPHIETIITERNQNAKDRDSEKDQKQKAQKKLKETQETLALTERNLTDTKRNLDQTQSRAEGEAKRANDLNTRLTKSQSELLAAQQELSAWKNLGLAVEQVAAVIKAEKQLRADLEVLAEEKKIIQNNLMLVSDELDKYRGTNRDTPPKLDPRLRGKVLVVDPKWNFVILSVGAKDNVRTRGELLVSRNGRLVAKIKVANVQAERSIANVLPGWSQDEILEGDIVLPEL
jgi:hypothetical protein